MVTGDTIFAQATAPGRAGVSVIRISGPGAFEAGRQLSGIMPEPRVATLRALTGSDGSVLDRALLLGFPAPNSFTGEDVLELHLHGSIAVVGAVLAELARIPGLRLAEPGEFTRCALLNGKMDLTQVEGLADLIEAQTEAQRRQAQVVLSGAFRDLVDHLRTNLVRAAAFLEAVIDFADEEVPEDVSMEVVELLDVCLGLMEKEIEASRFAERVRAGFEVAIIGAPNSGKSTLLNAIAGRDVAITSVHAGTTRDVIEVQMDLEGVPVTLLDTAGLREAVDPVEKIGVERAQSRARCADIRVFLVAPDEAPALDPLDGDVVLTSKADERGYPEDGISGLTGFGVDRLIRGLSSELKSRVSRAGLATRERHVSAFVRASAGLKSAREIVLGGNEEYDIASEEIRASIRLLDGVIGRVGVEDLLDVVFASFCLGK